MEELIKLLRDSRKEKKITLQDIAAQTKIKVSRLEAFEKGDFSVFAGEVYLKGAISSYAKAVGLDPARVLKIYQKAQVKVEQPPVDVARKVEKPRTKKRKGKNRILSVGLYTALALLFFVAIWVSIGKNMGRGPFANGDNRYDNAATQQADDDRNSAETGIEEKEKVGESKKAEIALENSSAYDTHWTFEGTDSLNVKIDFAGNCWIDLHVDGQNIHQENFHNGEELLLEVKESMRLRLGNPPVVKMFVNGIELEGLSDKNRPHNYHFSRKDV
ncbi:MAG: helix-turn-helix domain-containing protein [Firmicutes bacterium]|jgi:cytoskeletal protein RodZ|nr:helix-turn-helix domain-containing protein [Bacillota bacterium]